MTTNPSLALREAEALARVRAAVLASGQWLTSSEVAHAGGLRRNNPSEQPSRWKRDGLIFTITLPGKPELFPGYGLDSCRRHPLPALAKVIEIFRERKNDWGMAAWFASVNGFLGGERPQDLLATQPELVVAAAKDEMEGFAHG